MKQRFRKIITHQAKQMASNPKETADLLKKGAKLLKKPNLSRRAMGELRSMIQMVQASISREYPHLPWKTLVLVIGGVLYFVMPLDFIPDFIPVTGWLDDITVISGVAKGVSTDLRSFKEWKAQQST